MHTGSAESQVVAGRYRLDSHLGSGGMGTVWRGWDEVLRRQVAVKEVTIAPGLPDAEAELLRERYLREARATARLHHPSVVGVYDVIPESGRVWIVMELVNARDLAAVLREQGPLDPIRVAFIGLQLLDALDAAHAAGVLHRDVKPANVLIADEDRTVLTDFGVASVAGDSSLTRTGQLVGSPAYLAPERLTGGTVGPASDLWSLGCTLYASTEGKPPFARPEQFAIIAAITVEPVPPARNAGLLTPVLYGLLEKDQTARWDSAKTRAALGRVAAGEEVESTVGWGAPPPATPPDRTGDQAEPDPALVSSAAAETFTGTAPGARPAPPVSPALAFTGAAFAGSATQGHGEPPAPAADRDQPTNLNAGPPAAPPRKRRRFLTTLGVLLVAAVVAAGAFVAVREYERRNEPDGQAATPTPTPTQTGPPALTSEVFVHPTRGFRLNVPVAWSYKELLDSPTTRFNELAGAGRTDNVAINKTNNLYVYVHPAGGLDALQMAEAESARWASFNKFKHYQALSGTPKEASFGQNQRGSLLEFTADHTDLGPRHVLIFRMVVNDISYEVSLNGPKDKFASDLQIFDDAVDSLVISPPASPTGTSPVPTPN